MQRYTGTDAPIVGADACPEPRRDLPRPAHTQCAMNVAIEPFRPSCKKVRDREPILYPELQTRVDRLSILSMTTCAIALPTLQPALQPISTSHGMRNTVSFRATVPLTPRMQAHSTKAEP